MNLVVSKKLVIFAAVFILLIESRMQCGTNKTQKIMKKVVFLITFLLCGVFVYAQTSTENIGGLLYSIDTEAKTATLIANEDDEYKGDIFIPEKVKTKGGETYTVVSLGDKCFENCRIKSVIIPNTVKSLGDECFI